MTVLLTTLNAKYIHLNLAIRLLYYNNKDRHNLHWQEYTIKEDPQTIAAQCAQYTIVCFSCYIWNITQTLAVCSLIKTLSPTTKILLGGPEVSYEWHTVIAHDAVDYIITGEGEVPFAQFLNQYPHISLVPNLVHKANGSIQYLPQPVEYDLSLYDGCNPYVYDNPTDLANKVCYIETSRGCPYKCAFCLASLDNKVRYLPMHTIKAQLLYLMQHGKVIKFLDRTFNIKKDFTIDMFRYILTHHRPGNVFQFEITADIVHPDIVSYINEYVPKGLLRFEIGIQTVNQQSNLAVSRKQNFDKTASIIRQLQHKIDMHLDLIVGLPLDYWADTVYSFEAVFALHPPELQLGFLKFLKGTPVREKYAEHGYVYDPEPPYQIIQSNFLSIQELASITIVENALEIYWNKKRAKHTLKYVGKQYGIFQFLHGLGKHFLLVKQFHAYGLKDVYTVLHNYAVSTYPNDAMLLQLVAIDYYSKYNIKPANIFNIEVAKPLKYEAIATLKLNHHKYRFVIFPISFDYNVYNLTGDVIEAKQYIIITYKPNEACTINGIAYSLLSNSFALA